MDRTLPCARDFASNWLTRYSARFWSAPILCGFAVVTAGIDCGPNPTKILYFRIDQNAHSVS